MRAMALPSIDGEMLDISELLKHNHQMNQLPQAKRVQVVKAPVQGNSRPATARMDGSGA